MRRVTGRPFVGRSRRRRAFVAQLQRARREHESRLRAAHRRRRPKGLDARGAPCWSATRIGGRGQTADVSSAFSGGQASWPSWNPRAGRQSLVNGLEGQTCYRHCPAPVRPVCHDSSSMQSPASSVGRAVAFQRRAVRDERSLRRPHSPCDASELVGDGNRRDVVAASLLRSARPALEPGRL